MTVSTPQRSFRITVPCARGGQAACAAISAVESLLRAEDYAFEPQPFWDRARILVREPAPLGHSLAARLGLVYIQDRSSMLPPLALLQDQDLLPGGGPVPGRAVLDLCAAPGSKTGMLSLLAGPEALVLACEPSPDRLAVLRAGLLRTQAMNTATVRAAGERLVLGGPGLDSVLLDPPCSGWGTTDKHPRARELWTGDRVEPMLRLQRALLTRAAAMLAPGGRLAYSTCTSNADENEAQVRFALGELGLELLPLAPPPGVSLARTGSKGTGLDGVLNVALEAGQQGFFVALLAKPGGERRPDRRQDDSNPRQADRHASDQGDPNPQADARRGRHLDDRHASDPHTPDQAAWPGRALDSGLDADLPPALDFSGLGPGQVRLFGGEGSGDRAGERGASRSKGKGRKAKPGKQAKAQAVFIPARAPQYLEPAGPWQGTLVGRVQSGRFVPECQSRALLAADPGPGSVDLDLDQLRALASGASLNLGLPDGPVGVYWQGLALCWAVSRSGRLLAAIR